MFRKRISDKNTHYNFFLDDSSNPAAENPIEAELHQKYIHHYRNGEVFAYTVKNTWTKGKDFFFVRKGTVLKIAYIYGDRIFADVEFKEKVGLMKF